MFVKCTCVIFVKCNIEICVVRVIWLNSPVSHFRDLMKLWQVIECKHLFICFQGHGHTVFFMKILWFLAQPLLIMWNWTIATFIHIIICLQKQLWMYIQLISACRSINLWTRKFAHGVQMLPFIDCSHVLVLKSLLREFLVIKKCFAFQAHSSLHLQVKIQFVHCVYF